MDVEFPASDGVVQALVTRTPHFLAKLDHANLRARGVHSVGQYLQRYAAMIREFTARERARLGRVCGAARAACLRAGLAHLAEAPWRLAKADDRLENGYPHTVGDIIVLPARALDRDDRALCALLVHEATHVHQRQRPETAARQVRDLGFAPARKASMHRETLRANPDTDDTVYERGGVEANPVLLPGASCLAHVELRPSRGFPGLANIRNPEHVFEIIAELNEAAVQRHI